MPRVDLSNENRAVSVFDYPRLRLEKKGDRARVWIAEKQPLFEYIHNLRAPQIVNGEPVMETVIAKDGSEVEQMKYDFLGRPICHGDYGTIKDKGVDTRNCLACQKSVESDAVKPPERRFASHVWRYAINPSTFDVSEPFTGQLVAWVYGDNIFNKLIDAQNEWGDLQAHDLNLGPCTVVKFQKFEIAVAARAECRANEDRMRMVAEAYKNNQCKEMARLIGDRVEAAALAETLERILVRYKQAHKTGGAVAEPAPTRTEVAASIDVNSLFGTDVVPEGTVGVPDPAVPTATSPLAALIADEDKADEPRREALADAAKSAIPEPTETVNFSDFDELFK